MSAQGKHHTVRAGDSIESLAAANGLFWESVWLHGENTELRQRREQPNVLMPGDRVFIPARTEKHEERATNSEHRFVRKGVPSELNVQFQDLDGEPLSDQPYRGLVDQTPIDGTLDGDGRLVITLAPSVRRVHVEVGEDGEMMVTDLFVGQLDPIDEITGIQARLVNLGFFTGSVDGRPSQALNDAIAEFRIDAGVDEAPESEDDDFSVDEEPPPAGESETAESAADEDDDDEEDETTLRGYDDAFKDALREAHGT